ncbi:PIG-L family deacetylase [Streptomyces sp. NPDC059104]|uniref:PIG-L family deacetylase n=1 Tax=Streptomyces sp. NPDC059104 TaxID=3346729 RepID=UPI0036B101B8
MNSTPSPGRGFGRPRTRFLASCAVTAVLCGTAVSGVLHTGASPRTTPTAATTPQAPSTPSAAPAGQVRALDFVAHPDDDLYFMNPDVRHSIADGAALTTVYLTSGEADGRNVAPHEEKVLAAEGRLPAPDKPRYAEARQNGILAAYAQMATHDPASPWRRSVIGTAGGARAEVDVLAAKPSVQLVWLEMREAESVHGYAPWSLHGLWDGRTRVIHSQLIAGSPVTKPFTYTRSQVVATLTGLLERYRPTLVRTQDPTPGANPKADHQDHIYGARFVQAALARYAAAVPFPDRPHFTVQNYLGYQSGAFAGVLAPAAARTKLGTLKTYAWTGRPDDCDSTAGCGDLKVAPNPSGYHWSDDIRYARGNSTSWTAVTPHDGDWAFSVLDGQLAVWHSAGPGLGWNGPRLLPGTGLDQGAEAAVLPDGRVAVFASRTLIGFGSAATHYTRELVYTVERTAGGDAFTPWSSLGAPATDSTEGTLAFSAPAVTVGKDGRLSVYVRDGDCTLRARTQTGSGWTPWRRLGGSNLHGDPVAATAADGTGYVFAPTARSVLAWTTAGPARTAQRALPTGLPATTLPLTAVADGDGVRVWFREPESGEVLTATAHTGPGGLRFSTVSGLGDTGGYGPVAGCGGLLADRDGDGTLAVTDGSGHRWQSGGPVFDGAPSALCTSGGPTVAVIGADAALHTFPQTAGRGGLVLTRTR